MGPESGGTLEANLAALSRRDAALASAIRSSFPDPRIVFLPARVGGMVPAVRRGDGTAPLHSLVDPAREAAKIRGSRGGAGFVVCLGLGAGFLVSAFLDDPDVSGMLVVEKDAGVLRSLLENLPMARILADARVSIVAGLEGIRTRLPETWLPSLMGGLRTAPLRPWCESEREFFAAAAAALQEAIEAVRADYSVQSHFGKRWLWHMLLNMEQAQGADTPRPRGDQARVTAAGPSLDSQLGMLAAASARGFLLASDTSLPALLRSGIRPDGVLCIDCQIYGYHHFLQGLPDATWLFLDLASPPFLSRKTVRRSYVASGHPFAAYLAAHWKPFPRIDTSGGNVTHAAVSLARRLGARAITLFGADFSYPDGKPYARGTYLYDLFDAVQSRVSPVESMSFSFVLRSADTKRERVGTRFRYTTPVLLDYRKRLLGLMQGMDAEVIPVAGDGLSLGPAHLAHAPSAPPANVAALPPSQLDAEYRVDQNDAEYRVDQNDAEYRVDDWRAFLTDYAQRLESLPGLGDQPGRSLPLLPAEQRELWSTLLPVAARITLDRAKSPAAETAIEEARQWALSRIARVLSVR